MSEQAFGPEQEAEVLVTPIRRRPRSRKSVYLRPVEYSRIILTVIFLAALAAGAAYYLYARSTLARAPYAVSLEGRVLAVLRTQDDAERAISLYRARYAPKSPGVVTFVEGEPLVRPYGSAAKVTTPAKAADLLRKQLTPLYDGYAIFVNRKPLALLPTEEDALQTISLMLRRGLAGKQGIPTFQQRLAIDHLQLEIDEGKSILMLPPAELAAELVHPPRKRVYTVDLGDNFWKIATTNNITLDELVALNPGLDYHHLHKGDQVKLPDAPAPVTVVVRSPAQAQAPVDAPPSAALEPANSAASAENRAPVTKSSTAAGNGTPVDNGAAVTNRASAPTTNGRPPTGRRRSSTEQRAPETHSAPVPGQAPSHQRSRSEDRRSTGKAHSPAPQDVTHPSTRPDTVSAPAPPQSTVPKSYTEHRTPLKSKSAPDAKPAPGNAGTPSGPSPHSTGFPI